MQFTDEVNWNLMDFVVAGFLLYGASFILELAFRNLSDKRIRIFFVISLLGILLLVWAELAVGLFGTILAGS